jgi:hypothetical protein
MKQPKNQHELLQLLAEQDRQIQHQEEQIRSLKLAMLRLEQKLSKVAIITERVQGANRLLAERVRVVDSKVSKK